MNDFTKQILAMFFNAPERRGILILLILLVCLFVVPRQFLQRKNDFFVLQEVVGVADTRPGQIVDFGEIAGVVKHEQTKIRHKMKSQKTELNTADSVALVRLPGIGPYYASRIIHYRERLGGYYSVRQLKELKAKYLDIDSCSRLFTVNPDLIVCRDLDTMNFKAVLRHPYLDYEEVKLIFNAKRKYQTVSWELLEKEKILPEELLKKIRPYFR